MKKSCKYSAYDTYNIQSESIKQHIVTEKYGNISFDLNDDVECRCLNDICFTTKNGIIVDESDDGDHVNTSTNIFDIVANDCPDEYSGVQLIRNIESPIIRKILKIVFDDIKHYRSGLYNGMHTFGYKTYLSARRSAVDFFVFSGKLFNYDHKNVDNLLVIVMLHALCEHMSRLRLALSICNESDKSIQCDIFIIDSTGEGECKYKIGSCCETFVNTQLCDIFKKTLYAMFAYDNHDDIHEAIMPRGICGIDHICAVQGYIEWKDIFSDNRTTITNILDTAMDESKRIEKHEEERKKAAHIMNFCVVNKTVNKYSYDELCDFFYEWYTNKLLAHNMIDDGVGVYDIGPSIIAESEKKINPAYLVWSKKNSLIDINNAVDAPVKYIEATKEVQSVKRYLVGKVDKKISTLYLRQSDEIKLFTTLDAFKNIRGKHIGQRNPHKLGCLLYGPHGTGKTTTIKAIATFLDKDIYHIDLNRMTTIAKLEETIDYVANNSVKGCIFAFEDIDCEENIVLHQSTNTSTCTLNISHLLDLLNELNAKNDIVFIMTVNSKDNIDQSTYCSDMINIIIDLKLCDHYQIRKIFYHYMKREIEPSVLSKIPQDKYSPAEIIQTLVEFVLKSDVSDSIIMHEFMCEK